MGSPLKERFERSYQVFRLQQAALFNRNRQVQVEVTVRDSQDDSLSTGYSQMCHLQSCKQDAFGDDDLQAVDAAIALGDQTNEADKKIIDSYQLQESRQKRSKIRDRKRMGRKWNAINSMLAIKFKLLI